MGSISCVPVLAVDGVVVITVSLTVEVPDELMVIVIITYNPFTFAG